MVNLPLIDDQLAMRITGGYRYTAGYIDAPNFGGTNVNWNRLTSGRASILYTPVERLSLQATVDIQRQEFGDSNLALVSAAPDSYTNPYYAAESAVQPTYLYGLTGIYDFGWATLTSATNYIDKPATAYRDLTTLFP